MRVTTSGLLTNLVHRPYKDGTRRTTGERWEQEEAWFGYVCTGFSEVPTRVRFSAAQAAELSDPQLFGTPIECSGNLVREGMSQVIECGSYRLSAPATK